MESVVRVQFLDEADYISLHANERITFPHPNYG